MLAIYQNFSAMENRTKLCMYCNDVIKGRSDKKYCNDECRNRYNLDRTRESVTEVVKEINTTLKQNRKILLKIASARKNYAIVKAIELIRRGYNFHYHTHFAPLGRKNLVCCFDVGYAKLEKNKVIIIRVSKLPENLETDLGM